jgi:hypothetical protein
MKINIYIYKSLLSAIFEVDIPLITRYPTCYNLQRDYVSSATLALEEQNKLLLSPFRV